MWAALRPGGVIIVEDADFDGLFCDPPNDGFEFYPRMYPALSHSTEALVSAPGRLTPGRGNLRLRSRRARTPAVM
jgi:hypothetical protein